MSRRPVRAALLAALGLLAFFATRAPGALGPRYGGQLRVGVAELGMSLTPDTAPGVSRRFTLGLVHATLLEIGPDGEVAPGLATGAVPGAGEREWTLALDGNARFHDGRPVTSEDAARALRVFVRSAGTAAAALARGLEGGAAFRRGERDELPGLLNPDGQRVVLRLVSAGRPPLAALASPAAAVTSPDGAGAGPFVPGVFVPGQRLALTASPGHVRGRPFLDRVQVTAHPDPAALAAELRAARLDLAGGEAGLSAPTASLLLVLDPERPPFDRAEARTAVAAAIDRTTLVNRFVPEGEPSESLLPPLLVPPAAASPSVPPRATPPGLLDARPGLTSPGELTLAVSREVPPAVSQRMVAHLAALGARVRVVPVSPAEVARTAAELRLFTFLPEVPDAALALGELLGLASAPSGLADRLEAASLEPDPLRRRERLAEVHDGLRRHGAILAFGTCPVRFGARASVHDARIDLGGRLVLEDAWVEP